uniref:RING-type domain-containing protein n=1 Tax=Meloidogyne floridensis TaxID=298350 RepID=A0A915ND49_9BILA
MSSIPNKKYLPSMNYSIDDLCDGMGNSFIQPNSTQLLNIGEECCILCEKIIEDNLTIISTCRHLFHNSCITRYFNKNGCCPTCFGENAYGESTSPENAFGDNICGFNKDGLKIVGESADGLRTTDERRNGEKSLGERIPAPKIFGERIVGENRAGTTFRAFTKGRIIKIGRRQYSIGGNSNDSSTNSPLTKKQQLINSISSLNFENLSTIPSDPNIPDFAKSLLEQQQLIIKQLSGLLKIASELICEKEEPTAPSTEQQNHLLVITGLPESVEKRPVDRATSDKNNILEILNELEVDRCLPTSIFRMGRQRPPNEKPRPIKIIMPCSAAANEAIKNKRKLAGGKFKNVIIRRSLTKEELEERAALIERCKIKRNDT